MHPFRLPQSLIDRVTARNGRPHAFDSLNARSTALIVVDMQNYFVKPGFMGAVPMAREIVPGINRMAEGLRRAGGHVVWLKNSTNDTRDSWSTFHNCLMKPEKAETRYRTMTEGHEGHELWHELQPKPEDAQIVKKRFSAFIQGSSTLDHHLRSRGLETLLVAGTATNVCCESSARDAMMLNYKVVMLSDGTAAFTDEEHQASLASFYGYFGDVQTIDEALAALGTAPDAACRRTQA